MVLKEWNEDDKPREKLMEKGAAALSDAELLAILIGSGVPGVTAVDLMKQILYDVGNDLNRLSKLSIHDLCRYNGIGPAKAITILAATELGKRRRNNDDEREQVTSAEDMFYLMHEVLRDAPTEEAWLILLNTSHRLIKKVRLSHGGLTETLVDIRVALKEALMANATVMVLVHNHPSGRCKPSAADDRLTKDLQEAARTVRIRLLDHVIVVEGGYYSYAEEGRL